MTLTHTAEPTRESAPLAWSRPPPEETLARVWYHRAALGLTRLANITKLDRIGLPVVLAVRPRAWYLSVDAGKGVTLDFARASAAMESVERYAGEVYRPQSWRESYADCARKRPIIPREALPLSRNSVFNDELVIDWDWAEDLDSGERIALPAELVGLDRYRRTGKDALAFQTGSNGLSAGNNVEEAIFGGLCELIERDAVAIVRVVWDVHDRAPPRLRLAPDDPNIGATTRGLIARFEDAGLEVAAFDCRQDIDVPVYMVYAIDRFSPELGLFRGYGCHVVPEIALQRALTEAAQGRLVTIAGSRDDLFGHNRIAGRPNYEIAAGIVRALPRELDLPALGPGAPRDPVGGIAWLRCRLSTAGIDRVLWRDLTVPGIGIPVVRVIVPELEGYVFESYAPGPRARARLQGEEWQ